MGFDLLPDRKSESLQTWLASHPGIEVISRDRAGAYATGARQGAPQATQIADRFHLLKNLLEGFEKFLHRLEHLFSAASHTVLIHRLLARRIMRAAKGVRHSLLRNIFWPNRDKLN